MRTDPPLVGREEFEGQHHAHWIEPCSLAFDCFVLTSFGSKHTVVADSCMGCQTQAETGASRQSDPCSVDHSVGGFAKTSAYLGKDLVLTASARFGSSPEPWPVRLAAGSERG